jgi:hypothetical protein
VVYLPVSATSPRAGTVQLDFGDASTLPGFAFYLVFRDGTKLDQVLPGQAPPYLVVDVDPQTEHCYRVEAVVVSDAPTPPAAKPACLAADGRSRAGTPAPSRS